MCSANQNVSCVTNPENILLFLGEFWRVKRAVGNGESVGESPTRLTTLVWFEGDFNTSKNSPKYLKYHVLLYISGLFCSASDFRRRYVKRCFALSNVRLNAINVIGSTLLWRTYILLTYELFFYMMYRTCLAQSSFCVVWCRIARNPPEIMKMWCCGRGSVFQVRFEWQ